LKKVFDDVTAPLEEIWAALKEVFSALIPASDGMSDFGGVLGVLKSIVRGLAQAIGFLIKIGLWPLKIAFQAIGFLVKQSIDNFMPLIKGLTEWFGGVVKVIRGIMSFDFSLIWEGIKQVWSGLYHTVIGFFKSLVKGIIWPFEWLYNVLVGHSIIPDLVEEIVMWFLTLPIKIIEALGKLGAAVIGKISDTFGGLMTGLGDFILDGLKKVFIEVPMMLMSALAEGISSIPKLIMDAISGIGGGGAVGGAVGGVGNFLGGLASGAKGIISGLGDAISSLNPFDAGATNISADQVGVVHKGEMVVPADEAQGIRGMLGGAPKEQPYGASGSILGLLSSVLGGGVGAATNAVSGGGGTSFFQSMAEAMSGAFGFKNSGDFQTLMGDSFRGVSDSVSDMTGIFGDEAFFNRLAEAITSSLRTAVGVGSAAPAGVGSLFGEGPTTVLPPTASSRTSRRRSCGSRPRSSRRPPRSSTPTWPPWSSSSRSRSAS
jgi:phage-related protein